MIMTFEQLHRPADATQPGPAAPLTPFQEAANATHDAIQDASLDLDVFVMDHRAELPRPLQAELVRISDAMMAALRPLNPFCTPND